MAAKSNPVSVRISTALEALIDQEAQRTGRSRSAVLEALVDETLRMRCGRSSRRSMTSARSNGWPTGGRATERQIRLALAYSSGSLTRSTRRIAANPRSAVQLSDEYPSIAASRADV
jgi:hypothetical protein